jgi:hypothetical protein
MADVYETDWNKLGGGMGAILPKVFGTLGNAVISPADIARQRILADPGLPSHNSAFNPPMLPSHSPPMWVSHQPRDRTAKLMNPALATQPAPVPQAPVGGGKKPSAPKGALNSMAGSSDPSQPPSRFTVVPHAAANTDIYPDVSEIPSGGGVGFTADKGAPLAEKMVMLRGDTTPEEKAWTQNALAEQASRANSEQAPAGGYDYRSDQQKQWEQNQGAMDRIKAMTPSGDTEVGDFLRQKRGLANLAGTSQANYQDVRAGIEQAQSPSTIAVNNATARLHNVTGNVALGRLPYENAASQAGIDKVYQAEIPTAKGEMGLLPTKKKLLESEVEKNKGMGEYYSNGKGTSALQSLLAEEAGNAFKNLPPAERTARALSTLPQHNSPEQTADMQTIKQIEAAKGKLLEEPGFFELPPEQQAARIDAIHRFYARK